MWSLAGIFWIVHNQGLLVLFSPTWNKFGVYIFSYCDLIATGTRSSSWIPSPERSIRKPAKWVWTELSTAERSLYCTRQLWRRLHLMLQIATWEVKWADWNRMHFWPSVLKPWSPKNRKHSKAENVKKLETNYFHSLDLLDNLRKEICDGPHVERISNPTGPAEDSAHE